MFSGIRSYRYINSVVDNGKQAYAFSAANIATLFGTTKKKLLNLIISSTLEREKMIILLLPVSLAQKSHRCQSRSGY